MAWGDKKQGRTGGASLSCVVVGWGSLPVAVYQYGGVG